MGRSPQSIPPKALWIGLCFPQLESDANQTELESLAAWAGRFTPQVSLEPPCGLLLEVAGSLKLYGGLPALVRAMRSDLHAMGHLAQLAGAPTPRAAWWLARAGRSRFFTELTPLADALRRLPLMVLDCDVRTQTLLRDIGARTLGDLWDLPRDGLGRRCGQALLNQLDCALGRRAEPRRFHEPPPFYSAQQHLPFELTHADPLLQVAERLLQQLAGYLSVRNAAITGFEFILVHRGRAPTVVEIALTAPSREATHMLHLLRERLTRTALPAATHEVRLEARNIQSFAGRHDSLFIDDFSASQDWPRLVDQLRARLGAENVQGIALAAEHRPEYASVSCEVGRRRASPSLNFGLRPLWLLPRPRNLVERQGVPQFDGPLKLLAGPERIQSGWWDAEQEGRDYFIAQSQAQALLWIYRVAARGWYLHGWFA